MDQFKIVVLKKKNTTTCYDHWWNWIENLQQSKFNCYHMSISKSYFSRWCISNFPCPLQNLHCLFHTQISLLFRAGSPEKLKCRHFSNTAHLAQPYTLQGLNLIYLLNKALILKGYWNISINWNLLPENHFTVKTDIFCNFL